jgi:hypothetical protein
MTTTSKVVGAAAVIALGGATALFAPGSCNRTEACLSWQAPTRYTDGTTIPSTKTISYTVYKSQNAATLGAVAQGTTQAREMKITGLAPGTWYFAVTASVDGMPSVLSNTGSKLIRKPAPTEGAIEAPSDGAIETR